MKPSHAFNAYKILGTSHKTTAWLDCYTLSRRTALDWVMDHRKSDQADQRAEDKRYREMSKAWDTVRKQLQIFGLELDENQMEMWPDPFEVKANARTQVDWLANPELKLWRKLDIVPIHYRGAEAVVALAFLDFFVNSTTKIDPRVRVREILNQQGITKANFHEYEHKLLIQNPFINQPHQG